VTIDSAVSLFSANELTPQAGSRDRFGRRWRLVGAGLSNVWRYGDLELQAASGRLLMRGPNGTGKTTALEALWPYLLDLNPNKLGAGKARFTTLAALMREGATGKRRFGYVWLTFAGPGEEGEWSFGVRLQYSDGSTPPVQVVSFTVPGRPLRDLVLHGPGRAALTLDQFTAAVEAAGGQVFPDEDAYVAHLTARLWNAAATDAALLAARLREVRNPALLGDLSPQAAAAALRAALPTVDDSVITATADALAESDATRAAFARDSEAADVLEEFAAVWAGHVGEVMTAVHGEADQAARAIDRLRRDEKRLEREFQRAQAETAGAEGAYEDLKDRYARVSAEIAGYEKTDAYQAAGRLADLEATLAAQQGQAASDAAAMAGAAADAHSRGMTLRASLTELAADIDACAERAATIEQAAAPAMAPLAWHDRPRTVLRAGDVSADPGPGLEVTGAADLLLAVAQVWDDLAAERKGQADTARLALKDHEAVASADECAVAAEERAAVAESLADAEAGKLRDASRQARAARDVLLARVRAWTQANPELGSAAQDDSLDVIRPWSQEDLAGLDEAEPAQALVVLEEYGQSAHLAASGIAAAMRADARTADDGAAALRQEADVKRQRAAELRSGDMLPLPRPEWAGAGDDSVALGAALDWEGGTAEGLARDLIESALAASGLLGATIEPAGVHTAMWSVTARGALASASLADVLTADPQHPLGDTVAEVLKRIPLAETAPFGSAALTVGRDGTFSAGVLRGRAPGAGDPAGLPRASHIGARQRRVAALAQAELLESEATDLTAQAATLAEHAARARSEADAVLRSARTFPSSRPLRDTESLRSTTAKSARDTADQAASQRQEARRLRGEHYQVHHAWAERTRALNLPPDTGALVRLRDTSDDSAGRLREAARQLRRLPSRLTRLLAEVADDGARAAQLAGLESRARASASGADRTRSELGALRLTLGASIEQVLAQHAQAKKRAGDLEPRLEPARQQHLDLAKAESGIEKELATQRQALQDAEPTAAAALAAVRGLLTVPGVMQTLFSTTLEQPGAGLLALVGDALTKCSITPRRTVRERYDTARAKLAGVWALEVGETYGNLDTYILTHRDETYAPADAATRARTLATSAAQALEAAEEKALRDFVIGRLPAAISTAWTRLHDWVREVNSKMRNATASSGVGVQVEVRIRDDLPPAVRTTYELACRRADVDRTVAEREELGRSLQALISAADGEHMTDRIAAAVDIREWVDVHYRVTRPDGSAGRWTPRTGLSSGERRLVVLAPMLAAMAAAYDKYGQAGSRLAALDEIPSEVDERGREGLARYIAELDLDLVCTSYLWDGAPGAWDGVDAHDLEAAPDGTVVAFPMLVRGHHPMPGDPARL
jgi:hypothetical protein